MAKTKSRMSATNSTKFSSADISRAGARLLDALRRGPVTTIDAQRDLGILAPSKPIHELKHLHGHNIQTIRIRQKSDSGKLHNVGCYVLISEGVKHAPD